MLLNDKPMLMENSQRDIEIDQKLLFFTFFFRLITYTSGCQNVPKSRNLQ